jgi:hypothetical protein
MTALVLMSLVACEAESNAVLVDLVTDYVPSREFTLVRTELAEPVAEGAPVMARIVERPVAPSDAFVEGARVAELDGIVAGTFHLRVLLFAGDGTRVAERFAIVDVGESASAVTIVISRGCRSVACPPPGSPELTACVGGRCVDPRCIGEEPEMCGDLQCMLDDDCTSSVACARGVCRAGSCLLAPDDSACPGGGRCDVELGCVVNACGDGACGAGEDEMSCPPDCVVCGDGRCSPVETPADCPSDCGSCPAFRVTRTPGAPCSAANRDCVNACPPDDLFCRIGCLDGEPNGACEACGARNQWACILERTDCDDEFDCYAACADSLCLSPFAVDCWLRSCNPSFAIFGQCIERSMAGPGCASEQNSCYPP